MIFNLSGGGSNEVNVQVVDLLFADEGGIQYSMTIATDYPTSKMIGAISLNTNSYYTPILFKPQGGDWTFYVSNYASSVSKDVHVGLYPGRIYLYTYDQSYNALALNGIKLYILFSK